MSDVLHPGDLVKLDKWRGMQAFVSLYTQPIDIHMDAQQIGELSTDDVALVICCSRLDIQKRLILTSTGLLGWAYTSALKRVTP